MRLHTSMSCLSCFISIPQLLISYLILSALTEASTPIVVRNVTILGPQLTPDVTNVSRDGGYSALINDKIIWLYDDTECMDTQGNQLSFISNTAAYANQPGSSLSTATDFGVVSLGTNPDGSPKTAILAHTTVGTGGWIPFQPDELQYNEQMKGKERVAICKLNRPTRIKSSRLQILPYLTVVTGPGTSPTSISTTEAFLYAPLVYVDSKPQDPSKEYQARGMTLITITAPNSGPVAARQGDLIIPGTEVAYGGFSSILGYKSTDAAASEKESGDRTVYLLGMTAFGLQLARVGMNHLSDFSKYRFWSPQDLSFSASPPHPRFQDTSQIYLPGTFSSGSVFFSPYFKTFIMVYFNKMVDSTFYIRYLQLNAPLGQDATWIVGGKDGNRLEAEDAEALVKYTWSAEQRLYASPPGPGGFNYAGMAHPEYFNTQYFPQSLYPPKTPAKQRVNKWYGSGSAGIDGKALLLSWTSQVSS